MKVRAVSELLKLSKSPSLTTDFNAFIDELLLTGSSEMRADHISFWYHNQTENQYTCMAGIVDSQRLNRLPAIQGENYYELFPLVNSYEIIQQNSSDDHNWDAPRLGKLISEDIKSWMCMPLRFAESQIGFLFSANKSRRVFDIEDQNVIFSLGQLAKEAFLAKFVTKKADSESYDINFGNAPINDFAFYTAHNLRHPVTNILSLIEMIRQTKNDEKVDELLDILKVEAMKFDDVIKIMIMKIEENGNQI